MFTTYTQMQKGSLHTYGKQFIFFINFYYMYTYNIIKQNYKAHMYSFAHCFIDSVTNNEGNNQIQDKKTEQGRNTPQKAMIEKHNIVIHVGTGHLAFIHLHNRIDSIPIKQSSIY